MAGNMEVDSLKSVMDVRLLLTSSQWIMENDHLPQLWLYNQSGMIRLSPAVSRMVSAILGLSNAFLGQTHTQARLNAIASYDQSNQLFKVSALNLLGLHQCLFFFSTPILQGILEQRNDVFLCSLD